ncbi:MAG: hypothetical protein AAB316_01520 [Bacteroidota bacterium]
MSFNNVNSLQIFQALQFATAIGIGILLAKSGLPTSQISIYEALLFIANLTSFFWIVGGQNTLLQLFPTLGDEAKKTALFNIFLLFTAASLATGSFLFFTQDFVSQRLTNFTHLPHLDLLSLFILLNSPAYLLSFFYLLLKKYQDLVVYAIVSSGLQIVAVTLPIFLGYSLRESMFALFVLAGLKFGWCAIVVLKHGKLRFDPAFFKKFLPLAAPLLLLALLGRCSEYVSGLAVARLFEDEKAFAIFRFGAREFPIAVLMVGALATSLVPEVIENLEVGLRRIKDTTRRLSHWLYPISMVSMLASPFLFPILFNPDFKDSARIYNIFTLLLTSRILLPQVVLMSKRKNYVQNLSVAIEVVVIIFLSWWLGKNFGLEGIAFATVIGFMVEKLVLVGYAWRVLKIPVSAYLDGRIYLIYNVLLVATYLVSLKF